MALRASCLSSPTLHFSAELGGVDFGVPAGVCGSVITYIRKRPDIVVVHYGFRAGDTYTEECPDGSGPQQIPTTKKRIKLLEVSYTNIQNMRHREYEKRVKYEMTLQALSEAGWEPELFVLVLGTLGEIPATAVSTLTDFGIRGVELQSLLRNLHMNALSWMDKCIDEEIELNKWNTYFAYHMRKRKRWR